MTPLDYMNYQIADIGLTACPQINNCIYHTIGLFEPSFGTKQLQIDGSQQEKCHL